MSSTDEELLRTFFRDRLAVAAESLRQRGVTLFPTQPEPDVATWYVGPPTEPEFVELDDDRLSDVLESMWESQGLPELAALAGPLLELGEALKPTDADAVELSPFIYVMY